MTNGHQDIQYSGTHFVTHYIHHCLVANVSMIMHSNGKNYEFCNYGRHINITLATQKVCSKCCNFKFRLSPEISIGNLNLEIDLNFHIAVDILKLEKCIFKI